MHTLATLAAVKRVVILTSGCLLLVGGLINVILIFVLNPVFDPDWRKHDPIKSNGPRAQITRASMYARDVVYTRKGWNRYEEKEYDYRGKVTDGTAVLCWIYWGLLFGFALGVVVWGGIALVERIVR